ncbi:MAG: two-component system sensor histidine kinase KdbD [Aeromicrobium sp.]|nr:two-component system sensor histidine kinase KdbD [Burkholderiales bacterium]
MNEQTRPDPDRLLAQLQEDDARSRRGRLKVFVGANAGVGKTYAMLASAGASLREGRDVVIGVIETHGRKETAALVGGIEILPFAEISTSERIIREFDLDAALKRRPALLLVDELAHTNAPGSRHAKRWQDVEELLQAGIDVHTTLNIQHIESLNDVVGSITGVKVWETVPDHVFGQADEVTLVDIPPDELLKRLEDGKVYLPEQAQRAAKNFFRKGNLIALRELALRRTADHVDAEVKDYRDQKSIERVWATRDALLACVSPREGGERVVRATARLADSLDAPWHAVYVETPKLQRLPEAERTRILNVLKLAQDLGARTATLAGESISEAVVVYARENNLNRVVIGRESSSGSDWNLRWPWRATLADRVLRAAPELDVMQIARGETNSGRTLKAPLNIDNATEIDKPRARGYVIALASCAVTSVIATALLPYFALANIVMLFLLNVVLVSARLGRGPAILSAFLSVASFDFFFVPPRFSFAVSDAQYLFTFAIMLSVALITAHLTAGLRYQARVSGHREGRARALYEMARELSGALTFEQVVEISDARIEETFRAKAALILPDRNDRLDFSPGADVTRPSRIDETIALWVYDRGQPAGLGTDTLAASNVLYLPLTAPMRTRGVLAIETENPRWLRVPEQRRQLDTFASLIAIALERVHYVEVAREAILKMESESLRNNVLAALSHDLRTPLTALIGMADSLTRSEPRLAWHQIEYAQSILAETQRLSQLVDNLLDMARLEAGEVKLNAQWQPVEEVVGSALRASHSALLDHLIVTQLPADLPLVRFDAVLIERVLCNLLENAAKYTPAGSTITIAAVKLGNWLEISVVDDGPGFPAEFAESLFDKFTRAAPESTIRGVGLGLAICRAVVEAHGGTIRAENLPTRGASFVFTLPLDTPPAIEMEEEAVEEGPST